MDIKNKNDKRIEKIKDYDILAEVKKYDYASEGILNKTLPKILFKGNSILVTFLQLIDLKIINILKDIDRIKRFKWISWY